MRRSVGSVWAAAAVASLILCTACDESGDTPGDAGAAPALGVSSGKNAVEADIDSRGGVLELESRVRVTFPEGALDEGTRIRVEGGELDELAERPGEYEPIGDPIVVTPHGLRLARPATVELAIDDEDSALKQLRILRLDDEKDRTWAEVKGIRVAEMAQPSRFAGEREVDRSGADSVTALRRLEFEVDSFSIFLPVRLVTNLGDCVGRRRGEVCREAAGDCDAEEVCDGDSADCPEDMLLAGTQCRASAGQCDVAEVCDGASADCPEDGLRAEGSVCRPMRGECDTPEVCDGSVVQCPADVMAQDCPADACGGCPSGQACDPQEDVCVPISSDLAPQQLAFTTRGNTSLSGNLSLGAGISVTDNTSASLGTASVNSDGTFTFTLAAPASNTSDSFMVTTGDGTDSVVNTVTISITAPVWWADGAASGGGNGTSESPFSTISAAVDALPMGDVVALGNLSGNATLKADQALYGDKVTSDLGDGLTVPAAGGNATTLDGTVILPAAAGGTTLVRGLRISGDNAGVRGTSLAGTYLFESVEVLSGPGSGEFTMFEVDGVGEVSWDDVQVTATGTMRSTVIDSITWNVDVGKATPTSSISSTDDEALTLFGAQTNAFLDTVTSSGSMAIDMQGGSGTLHAEGVSSGTDSFFGIRLDGFLTTAPIMDVQLRNISLQPTVGGTALSLRNLAGSVVLEDVSLVGGDISMQLENISGLEVIGTNTISSSGSTAVEFVGNLPNVLGPRGVTFRSINMTGGGCTTALPFAGMAGSGDATSKFAVTGDGVTPGSGGTLECSSSVANFYNVGIAELHLMTTASADVATPFVFTADDGAGPHFLLLDRIEAYSSSNPVVSLTADGAGTVAGVLLDNVVFPDTQAPAPTLPPLATSAVTVTALNSGQANMQLNGGTLTNQSSTGPLFSVNSSGGSVASLVIEAANLSQLDSAGRLGQVDSLTGSTACLAFSSNSILDSTGTSTDIGFNGDGTSAVNIEPLAGTPANVGAIGTDLSPLQNDPITSSGSVLGTLGGVGINTCARPTF